MIRTDYDIDGKPIAENYEDHLIQSLKDPAYAKDYLNAALEDDDYHVFLLALRDVANAFGITNLASNAELNRENIYKMLSAKGNPRISSLMPLLRAIGIRLSTETAPKTPTPVKQRKPKAGKSLIRA
ncbi:MAG: putative addiction module antidote protein [Blastocatellia bacterium]|nr:putative addiction module antidote protein [Blastocatellia bacterium]MDQ3221818.1 putative addiction module antidote protein [Acidobacteriota bacterium]